MKPLIILNFHGIGTPHGDVPDDERPYWLSKTHFETVLDKIVQFRKTGNHVKITFDDGNKSDLKIATPLLLDRDLKAEFFVLLGRINDPHYLSVDDICMLQKQGMGVGLHGRHHLDWRTLDAKSLKDETEIAAQELMKIIKMPVDKVAIPFGGYNKNVIQQLKSLQFQKILTSDGGGTRPENRIQARSSLRSDTSTDQLDAILNNRYGTKARVRRKLSQFVRQKLI